MAENTDKTIFAKSGGALKAAEETFFVSPDYAISYDFPYNPEPLASGNNYDTFDEMRRDDQVKAALSVKKDFILSSGWHIVCEDEAVQEFVTETLKDSNSEYLGETFDSALRDILTAYDYGFSLAEVIYKFEAGKYKVKGIKVRPPHTFRFNIDDFGNVQSIEQTGAKTTLTFKPDTFLHFAPCPEFGNPYGVSDLVAAHPAWVSKKFFLRMYAVYCERFATPTVIGRFSNDMGDDEIARLHTVLKSIQNNTVLTLPADMQVEFQQAQRDASTTYSDGIDLFNMWIARAILVPDLLGISGSKTAGGSYNLGEKQFNIFMASINKDRNILAAQVTRKIIKPLVRANFGDIKCDFEFMAYDESDQNLLMDTWIKAATGKLFKPNAEEINYLRRNTGFPEGDVIDAPVAPAPMFPQSDKPELPPQAQPKEKEFAAMRELTPYEKKCNFEEIGQTIASAESTTIDGMKPIADKIINNLVEQVESKRIISGFKPEKLNDISAKFQKEMNGTLKSYMRQIFNKSLASAKKELFPSGDKHFVDSEILPEEFTAIIDAEAFRTVGDYSTEMTKRAKSIVSSGIKSGVSEGELVRMLRDEIRTASDTWIATVVRTKTTEMYNSARKIYWETDPVAKDLVEAYQYSAILDDRTSDVCRSLDGKIFEKGEYIDRITPPLHFNCRSVLVPITRYEDYKVSRKPDIDTLKNSGGNLIV